MPNNTQDDTKQQLLLRSGSLHPNPESITDELFQKNTFFDSRDLVQVKYEMLRRVRVDGKSISQSAVSFGLSRPTYYEVREAFEHAGLLGLLPQKKGPKRAHKFSEEVLAFIDSHMKERPDVKPSELAELIKEKLGVKLHPKSIGRAIIRTPKKTPQRRKDPQ